MGSTAESRRINYVASEPVIALSGLQVSDGVARPAIVAHEELPSTPYTRWGKRLFDVVSASILLAVLALPMLIIALTIRFTTEGRILFRQSRVGRNGRLFQCLKFRTMVPNAEAILAEDSTLREEMSLSWKLTNDPRVTPIGNVLRRSSLDELPQLLNVIAGDMSLVGPRPVQPSELEDKYMSVAAVVTSVRPGMTGIWQVSGRSLVSYDDRISMDLEYVYGTSFGKDLRILLRTALVVVLGTGAA